MNRKWIVWVLCFGTSSFAQSPSTFDKAVKCIKAFEGLHAEPHYPYVGYGHRLVSNERIERPLTEEIADSLLRSDLRKKCAVFRRFGVDSLLLGTLAFNVGEFTLLGYGTRPKSRLIKKLEAGNRNIRLEYLSFRFCRGKAVKSLEKRRKCEFELLFVISNKEDEETKLDNKDSIVSGIDPDENRRTCWEKWHDSRGSYSAEPPN